MQKEFFLTEPFNPSPYWDNTIVNLSGNQKFEQNTVFFPGRYKIVVQAGAPYSSESDVTIGLSSRIEKTIDVSQYFIVRAYCGSKGTSSSGGKNPYSGAFKVNSVTSNVSVPYVSHIFGNAGSYAAQSGISPLNGYRYSSGNCLGNGAGGAGQSGNHSIGAGSCLHLIPVNGVFGTDYLFAFHCTSGTMIGVYRLSQTISYKVGGGVGSAYGGAGSGTVLAPDSFQAAPATSYAGGSTPYGTGGAGQTVQIGNYQKGKNGNGIGYGYGGNQSANGSGAWFNGTSWVDSRTTAPKGADGYINITYLGPIN